MPRLSIRPACFCIAAALFFGLTSVSVQAADPAVAPAATPSQDERAQHEQAETGTTETRQTRTIVAAVPVPLGRIHAVSAERTPSGFAVPRYVSLKFGEVNARTGPSRDHAIAYQYRRRGLPLIVVAETEMWRKVRDMEGDEAWVRKPALSGERSAIVMSETVIRRRPDPDARATARIERGALVRLRGCADGYCEIATRGGVDGYAPRDTLWGAQPIG